VTVITTTLLLLAVRPQDKLIFYHLDDCQTQRRTYLSNMLISSGHDRPGSFPLPAKMEAHCFCVM